LQCVVFSNAEEVMEFALVCKASVLSSKDGGACGAGNSNSAINHRKIEMSAQVKLSYPVSVTRINPRITTWVVVVSCILLLASTAAEGAVFLNRSAWDTAAAMVGPIITESFDGIPPQEFPDGTTANLGVILFDITLLGGPGDPGTERIVAVGGGNRMQLKIDADNVFRINIDFDEPVYGFAANWFGTTTGDDLVVRAAGVDYLLSDILGEDGGTGFFGILTKIPFTRIGFTVENLTATGEDFLMDNLSVVVPEPATILLFGLGSLAFLNRRK
jgi:hypothetical protein